MRRRSRKKVVPWPQNLAEFAVMFEHMGHTGEVRPNGPVEDRVLVVLCERCGLGAVAKGMYLSRDAPSVFGTALEHACDSAVGRDVVFHPWSEEDQRVREERLARLRLERIASKLMPD